MNAPDVMAYGHATIIASAEKIPTHIWLNAGVCGVWSTRDVLAHLASYERVLGDILALCAGQTGGRYLDAFLTVGD